MVEHLTLRVSIREVVPDELHVEEDAYLKLTRLAGTGSIRPAMATYYCTPGVIHDFYRLGTALPSFSSGPRWEMRSQSCSVVEKRNACAF